MISASAEWANRSGGVAIVGMAGRFPGADDVESFWRNLRAGVESIRFFSEAELLAAGVPSSSYRDPSYLPASGFLPGIEMFDAGFFGFTPREAQIIDPQHRLFLESAWSALENAGYDPKRFPGLIGVYAGCGSSEYLWRHVYPHREVRETIDDFQLFLASDKDFLSTRVSYKLDLRGPSLTVQTACSTALVAICMAWQSLLTFQCDMALAGGVSVDLQGRYGHRHREGMIMSPDGHCRAFDVRAQGTVGGDGVGVVVLKRLEDALAKGDHIYAVIKGAALNNDGSSKVGYTAPSISGQVQVIAQALAVADIAPATVSYIEAHGTGTPLGDPIEIAALTEVFRGVSRGACAIGSVKTNVGHLNSAAGVAGLIKTVQALYHRELPPSLHFTAPNPKLDLENSPFYVNTSLRPWTASPRRAGVSSFGIGGTNAHVVLEAAPPPGPSGPSRPYQLLTLSAKTASSLAAATENLITVLSAKPAPALSDVAYTLHVGRQQFNHRCFAVCRDSATACQTLHVTRRCTSHIPHSASEVVFLFPGGGSQYPNMGRELYETEVLYREEVDRCALLLLPVLGFDVRREMYPTGAALPASQEQLQRTDLALVTLFVTEYALAQLWQSWGVTPKALLGHSLGEYTAACLAGVFSLEDALRIVAARGRLMAGTAQGAMLSVPLPADAASCYLGEHLALAALNGPTSSVISGPSEPIARLQETLRQQGIDAHRLPIAVGAHSPVVQPILAEFTREVAALRLRPPRLPFISNVTGTWITAQEATSPEYWARHLRQTVRFGDGLAVLLAESPRIFLEVGPGHTLRSLATKHPLRTPEHILLASMRSRNAPQSDVAFLLETAGNLWLAGGSIDWEGFHRGEKRHRIPLPTYPFERQRFWMEAPQPALAQATPAPEVAVAAASAARDGFYRPVWRPAEELPDTPAASGVWLIFSDETANENELPSWSRRARQQLAAHGRPVVRVAPGDSFARRTDDSYTIRIRHRADYERLLGELHQRKLFPDHILHLWNLLPSPAQDESAAALERSFYSLFALAQALGNRPPDSESISLTIVTQGLHRVAGETATRPLQAASIGPFRVLPTEYAFLHCSMVDLPLDASGQSMPGGQPVSNKPGEGAVAQLLAGRLRGPRRLTAYRQGRLWVQTFEPTALAEPAAALTRLRPHGVYLITGGLGGIGLELAEYLARAAGAKLILIGRSPAGPEVRRRLQTLEQLGAEVMTATADIADRVALQAVLAAAHQRFGALSGLGIIHAAGIAGGGAIQTRTLEAAAAVLRPKVDGTLVLAELTRKLTPDFFILCSSLNALTSQFGQADYGAANAFLDAFAQQNHGMDVTLYMSINWDAWREVGIAARSASRLVDLSEALTPAEGVSAFQRCLASPLPQVVISTVPLLPRLQTKTPPERPAEPRRSPVQMPAVTFPRPALSNPYMPPQTEPERRLCTIWQSVLGIAPIGVTDGFPDLGGDSLMAVALLSEVRKHLQIRLPPYQLTDTPTIAELATAISRSQSSRDRPAVGLPLVELQAPLSKPGQPGRPILFLMHPGSGHVHLYRDLTYALGIEQPVYALQSRAVDGCSEPLASIEAMAESYVAAIRTVQPEGPYALGGASLGGMIAYEMARQLTAQGQRVGLLALFDTAGPGQLPAPLADDAEILAYMMHMDGDRAVSVEALRQLSPKEQWRRYWSRSQVFSGLIPEVAQSQLRILLRVWNANAQAMQAYLPQPCTSRIIFFLARDKDIYNSPIPEQSWLKLAHGGIEINEVSGNHITMNYAPHVQRIADRLRECLALICP